MTQETFGKLTVLECLGLDKNKHKKWKCLCECGNYTEATTRYLRAGYKTHCGCSNQNKLKGSESKRWKGYEEISLSRWNKWIREANQRHLEFTITIDYAWNLFLEQQRKCKLSGEDLVFHSIKGEKDKQTASLDRIDSKKGYIEGNVQWVHKHVNLMKQNFDESYFLEFVRKIGAVAQLGERIPVKDKVAGSKPVSPAK